MGTKREHPSGLTVQAQKAVEAYLEHGNKAKAYEGVYGRGMCNQQTFDGKVKKFFARADVLRELRRRREEMSRRTDVTVDRIVERLAQIAFTDLPGVVDWDGRVMRVEEFANLSREQRAAIEQFEYFAEVSAEAIEGAAEEERDASGERVSLGNVKIKIKMKDNISALKLLGQHLGMFEKRTKVALVDTPLINIMTTRRK